MYQTRKGKYIISKKRRNRTMKNIDGNKFKPVKYYKDLMKDFNNVPKDDKHIFIFCASGFGNKVFYLIIALYLYNLYKGRVQINFMTNKSKLHDKEDETPLYKIFPKSMKKINYYFILPREFVFFTQKYNIKKLDDVMNVDEFYELNELPTYDQLPKFVSIPHIYNLAYKMYASFNNEDKSIFNISPNLITDKNILNIARSNYSLFQVRYSDKLHLAQELIDTRSFDYFLIYTPEYYIEKINEILKKKPNEKIIIISDTIEVVNEFIVKNNFENNKNVQVLDTNWLNAFYLFYYANNIVMSRSTYGMSGAYFNKKNAEVNLVMFHSKNKNIKVPMEEYAISPKWKISYDNKYILNYNPQKLKQITEFCNDIKINRKCNRKNYGIEHKVLMMKQNDYKLQKIKN